MSRRAMRPMVEALNLQRRFVADASHELRTPLTLLSTRAQLLRRGLPAQVSDTQVPGVGPALDELVADSQVLAEILEDLLIAADPRKMSNRDRTDLTVMAADIVESMQPESRRRQIVLRRIGSAGPVTADVARVSFRRLFTALLANALDHAATGVDVEVAFHGREAIIRVIDDGPGFAPDIAERAFDRFASTERPDLPAAAPRHYGLGLSLVADVATRHNGSVSIEKRAPGAGAVVVVRIPAQS